MVREANAKSLWSLLVNQMFYEPPTIKGEIRNLKQSRPDGYSQDIFTYDIYFDDQFHSSHHSYFLDREAAINEAKKQGNFIRDKVLLEQELAAVGDKRYIKFEDSYYQIFHKGKLYCCFHSTSLDEAKQYLEKLELEDNRNLYYLHTSL